MEQEKEQKYVNIILNEIELTKNIKKPEENIKKNNKFLNFLFKDLKKDFVLISVFAITATAFLGTFSIYWHQKHPSAITYVPKIITNVENSALFNTTINSTNKIMNFSNQSLKKQDEIKSLFYKTALDDWNLKLKKYGLLDKVNSNNGTINTKIIGEPDIISTSIVHGIQHNIIRIPIEYTYNDSHEKTKNTAFLYMNLIENPDKMNDFVVYDLQLENFNENI